MNVRMNSTPKRFQADIAATVVKTEKLFWLPGTDTLQQKKTFYFRSDKIIIAP